MAFWNNDKDSTDIMDFESLFLVSRGITDEMTPIMTEEPRQTQLVARAQAGDRKAFDELVKKLQDRLKSFIRSRIKSSYQGKVDPDEVLQETLVRAFKSLKSFRGDDVDDFRRWLTGVANKTVLRFEEEARRRPTLAIEDNVAEDVPSPSKALGREERFDRLQGAFDSLKGDYREVIHLTRIDGLSIKEAAEKMGRSPEATKKLFWRALKQLRRAMAETGSLNLPKRDLKLRGGDSNVKE